MNPAVTMRAIAAQAGVTPATVSMSLANNPRIPAATRDRIRALAETLGYQPNPYVSALMRTRRQGRPLPEKPVLALVNAQRAADGWRNHASPTIRQFREGALARASSRGYRAQEFWLHRDGMSPERFSAMLHARGIRGLLLSPLAEGEAPPALRWEHFSTVSLSQPHPALKVTTVCNDHYFACLASLRECERRGYRRPGLVLHRLHQWRFQGRWQAGFLVGPDLLPGLEFARPLYVDDWVALRPVRDWLQRESPDVIITSDGPALLQLLKRAKRRVPADVGVSWLGCPRPGAALSGIWQNGERLGALAIDTLVGLVERHEHGLPEQATTLMLEGKWNEGRTLRAAPARPVA
jgi:DNA-binding LacI/PurR family transcriptional regulator